VDNEQATSTALSVATARTDRLRSIRRLGLAGSLLLAVGALGAGAVPLPNPLAGLRLVGLPARNPTISLAVAYAGLALVVLAWSRIAFGWGAPHRPSRADLLRAAATWVAPLLFTAPLFSRDVYSYLAQGAILAHGLDPYRLGPAVALDIDNPLVRSIPDLWRDTPAPYGPLFLIIGRWIADLTGTHVLLGVVAYRIVALAGLALLVWALPRLARRLGADPDRALWWGAANPLVLFHVVGGAHNDGLMVGLMLAGLEIGLGGVAARRHPALIAGAGLIVAASAIKAPAILAVAYLGLTEARARGGRPGDVARATGLMTAVAAAIYLVLALATGLGTGWLTTLEVPGSVVSFLSITTDLAIGVAVLGAVAGLGPHVATDLALLHGAGVLVAAALVARSLLGTLRGRNPVASLASGMAVLALLAVQTQPWYLLWALAPAAATDRPRLHRLLGGGCVVLAVLVPPTGGDFLLRGYQLTNAIAAASVLLLAWAGISRLDRLGPARARTAAVKRLNSAEDDRGQRPPLNATGGTRTVDQPEGPPDADRRSAGPDGSGRSARNAPSPDRPAAAIAHRYPPVASTRMPASGGPTSAPTPPAV
jgi:alpha-1,6-mannosyltransferase